MKTKAEGKERFSLGEIYSTPGALAALKEANTSGLELLASHLAGDWGDMCEEDKESNELAVKQGGRILSGYLLPTKVKLWVITEADRSATTILLPSEY